MGNSLSFPDMEKKTESGGDTRLFYVASAMRGWRITMEDAHTAILDLDNTNHNHDESPKNAFFGVYDGHGGHGTSKFAADNLHKRLLAEPTYHTKDYEVALKNAFLRVDEDLEKEEKERPGGCAAVTALITHDGNIYIANAGDSRAVLSTNGKCKELSTDHKPRNPAEEARIKAAGGYLERHRVNGNLALSRGFGDSQYKLRKDLPPENQIITADPEITHHEITDDDEFLILACIWDCLTSQQTVDIIRYQVSLGKPLSDIPGIIFDHCLRPDSNDNKNSGKDNMTMIIVAFLHGWGRWVVEDGYVMPELYSAERRERFRVLKEAREVREREREKEREVEREMARERVKAREENAKRKAVSHSDDIACEVDNDGSGDGESDGIEAEDKKWGGVENVQVGSGEGGEDGGDIGGGNDSQDGVGVGDKEDSEGMDGDVEGDSKRANYSNGDGHRISTDHRDGKGDADDSMEIDDLENQDKDGSEETR